MSRAVKRAGKSAAAKASRARADTAGAGSADQADSPDGVRAAGDSVLTRQGIDAAHASPLARAAIRPRPVVQERSRETLDRLLDAATSLLSEEGLEAATVPRIAARAGLSVGAVYRRFADKDAVMRAVYGRFFACTTTQRQMCAVHVGVRPALPEMARLVVGGMVASYRLHRGILRALIRYAQTHHDPEFRRQADAMNAAGLDLVEQLLLPYAEQMGHPEPRTAVRLGLYFVGFVLRETVLGSGEGPRLPIAEERLGEELTRMFLGYLGVAAPGEETTTADWSRWMMPPPRA